MLSVFLIKHIFKNHLTTFLNFWHCMKIQEEAYWIRQFSMQKSVMQCKFLQILKSQNYTMYWNRIYQLNSWALNLERVIFIQNVCAHFDSEFSNFNE